MLELSCHNVVATFAIKKRKKRSRKKVDSYIAGVDEVITFIDR